MTDTEAGPRPFDLVLFDLGNTLVYWDLDWKHINEKITVQLLDGLHQAGLMVDREAFAHDYNHAIDDFYLNDTEYIEYTTEHFLRRTLSAHGYENVSTERLSPIIQRSFAASRPHFFIEEDTIDVLENLRESGYRLGLISNASDPDDLGRLIDTFDLRPYFEMILISAGVGLRKPHPRIFHMALDHFNVEPQRAVMIGDTLDADVLGAHNAGMPGIWIARRGDRPDNHVHLHTILPDKTIQTLAELPDVLDNWRQQARV
jgi:HAD superfamily hydrolase (TIGR01662 family)